MFLFLLLYKILYNKYLVHNSENKNEVTILVTPMTRNFK